MELSKFITTKYGNWCLKELRDNGFTPEMQEIAVECLAKLEELRWDAPTVVDALKCLVDKLPLSHLTLTESGWDGNTFSKFPRIKRDSRGIYDEEAYTCYGFSDYRYLYEIKDEKFTGNILDKAYIRYNAYLQYTPLKTIELLYKPIEKELPNDYVIAIDFDAYTYKKLRKEYILTYKHIPFLENLSISDKDLSWAIGEAEELLDKMEGSVI